MRNVFFLGAAASLAVLAPTTAAAAINITSVGLDSLGGKSGRVSFSPDNFSATGTFGRSVLKGTDTDTGKAVTLKTFCVDLQTTLRTGTFFKVDPQTVDFDATKAKQIEVLLTNVYDKVTTATTSAAAQFAIWEIMYEKSSYGFDMDNGWLEVSGSDTYAARQQAETWLTAMTTQKWTAKSGLSVALIAGYNNQAQIYVVPSTPGTGAVPEPASWAMMIAGFGLVGTAMRRRVARVAYAA